MTHEERRLKAIAAAPPPAVVQAYTCGQCSAVYWDETEARECCTCDDCGAKFPRDSAERDFVCGYCRYPKSVRYAREEVDRCELQLKNRQHELRLAQARLSAFRFAKRPPKGSAPLKI